MVLRPLRSGRAACEGESSMQGRGSIRRPGLLSERSARKLAHAGSVRFVVLLLLASIAPVVRGQGLPPFEIKETFSFASCPPRWRKARLQF